MSRWSGARTACGTSLRVRSGWACATPAPRCPRGRWCSVMRSPRQARPWSRPGHTATGSCGRCTTAALGPSRRGLGELEEAGFPGEYGRDRVVPYVFPTPGMLAGLEPRAPAAIHGRAGLYCYDTMTLIGPGSWGGDPGRRRRRADRRRPGWRRSPAGLRAVPARPATTSPAPPTAVPAISTPPPSPPRRCGRPAPRRLFLIDVDADHGNGTQMIFYGLGPRVLRVRACRSGCGLVPPLRLRCGERGAVEGAGANRNLPLAPGTGDRDWLAAVGALCAEAATHHPDAVVMSLGGFGCCRVRPGEPAAGNGGRLPAGSPLVAALGPTVVVQEGGYYWRHSAHWWSRP